MLSNLVAGGNSLQTKRPAFRKEDRPFYLAEKLKDGLLNLFQLNVKNELGVSRDAAVWRTLGTVTQF